MKKKNKNFNKIIASSVTASVVVSSLVIVIPNANAAATKFKDVQSNAYFYEAVNSLHARNIISGYEDGTFRPNEPLTRAHAAKIIALALDLDTTNIKNPGFKDVSEKHSFYKYIAALADKGIIVGSEGEYRPNDPVNRAQMAKIISLAYDLKSENSQQKINFTDVSQDDWFNNYVGVLIENEITSGTTSTTFSPNKSVTRGQLAAFIYRSENKITPVPVPVHVNETISNITDETLVTSEGTYTLSDDQKKWINPSNLATLKGANLKLTIKENKIEQIQSIELTAKGTPSTDTNNPYVNHAVFDGKGATIDSTVIVNSDYITMKNISIKGDLHVGKGVENSFYSEFLRVEGKTTIDDSLQLANQTNAYKSFGAKVASMNNLPIAANETKVRGRVVFSEFQLGDVGVDKNADVIFLSKTSGASTVGEIVVNSNAILTAGSSVVLPKVLIVQGATDVVINSNVTSLQVTTTGEVKLSGKSDIVNLSLMTSANVNLQTIGRVSNLETLNRETKVTIGTETKIGNLVIPTGSKPADIIQNYNSVKSNVERVAGTKNPDLSDTSSDNSGSGSIDTTVPVAPSAPKGLQGVSPTLVGNDGKITGLNASKKYQYKLVTDTSWTNVPLLATEIIGLGAGNYEVRYAASGNIPASLSTTVYVQSSNQSQAPSHIQLVNYATAGKDMIALPSLPVGSLIKVYDASTNGNILGSFSVTTSTALSIVEILGGFPLGLNKVYVTVTENGKTESTRVEKGVPTTFPNAPAVSDITVTDNATGADKVTVKLPSPIGDYMISVYDVSGNQLEWGILPDGNGEKSIAISSGFANGMSEIDVAIIKVTDNGTQYAESLRTRVSIGSLSPLAVTAVDDPFSNDKINITVGEPVDLGNEFAFKVFDDANAADAGKPSLNADVSSWETLPPDGKISAAAGKVVVVVERTSAGKIAKKIGQVVANTIVNNPLLETVTIDGKDGVSSQDGKMETIRLKFSANIDPTTVTKDSFTVPGFTVESIKVTDKNGRTPLLSNGNPNPLYTQGENKYITIRVEPMVGTHFTPEVIQNPNESIIDINGVNIAGIHVTAVDQAAPVIISSGFIDNGSNGVDVGDQLTIIFSEDVNLGLANLIDLANDFTLSNQTNSTFAFANDDTFELLGNTITVTLGATTVSKIEQNTTITMSANGNDISLKDAALNKAKPQKEFVNEIVYSDAKTINITNIPLTIVNPITAPNAMKAQGTNAGTMKLTGLTDGVTYEYIIDSNATTSISTDWAGATLIPLSGTTEIDNISINAGQFVHIRIASAGGQPANDVQDLQIELSDIKPAAAPNATPIPSNAAGYTKLTGLTSGMTYEYFVDNNDTAADNAAEWSTATTITGVTYIEIPANTSQYIHIRIKATAEKPASYIKSVKGTGNEGP